jgi:hypothetical protein
VFTSNVWTTLSRGLSYRFHGMFGDARRAVFHYIGCAGAATGYTICILDHDWIAFLLFVSLLWAFGHSTHDATVVHVL